MIKTLPDKHIRKAIFDAFNGTLINGETINVYDSRYTGKASKKSAYVLMTVQSNDVDYNKCENFWLSNILLEVCTLYKGNANTGSRLLADDVTDALRTAVAPDLDLTGSGLEIQSQLLSFPNDLTTVLSNGTLFRKFIRIEMRIK